MDHPDELKSPGDVAAREWRPFDNLDRLYLAATSACCVALSYGISHLLGWPTFLKHEAGFLAGASPIQGMVAVLLAMFLCVLPATLLLGKLRYDAGLFSACIGLAALSNRGGTIAMQLRSAGRSSIYITLSIETILLLGVLVVAWQLLSLLTRRGWLAPEPPALEGEEAFDFTQALIATLIQAAISAILLMVLVQADNKKQVMASVLVASLIGALAAHQVSPLRVSVPYWIGPFIVALIGYLWAIKSPGHWQIGTPANPLAAASPLDYASLGTAGAIFGYWISRQWREGLSD